MCRYCIASIRSPVLCSISRRFPHFSKIVETAGNIIDRDSELVLFFNLPDTECYAEGCPRNSLTRMKIDFRNGQTDLFAIQRYISDKLLGPDESGLYSQHANCASGHHITLQILHRDLAQPNDRCVRRKSSIPF